jgi:hypothetical protein
MEMSRFPRNLELKEFTQPYPRVIPQKKITEAEPEGVETMTKPEEMWYPLVI